MSLLCSSPVHCKDNNSSNKWVLGLQMCHLQFLALLFDMERKMAANVDQAHCRPFAGLPGFILPRLLWENKTNWFLMQESALKYFPSNKQNVSKCTIWEICMHERNMSIWAFRENSLSGQGKLKSEVHKVEIPLEIYLIDREFLRSRLSRWMLVFLAES